MQNQILILQSFVHFKLYLLALPIITLFYSQSLHLFMEPSQHRCLSMGATSY